MTQLGIKRFRTLTIANPTLCVISRQNHDGERLLDVTTSIAGITWIGLLYRVTDTVG